jgi:hypothetical protein
MYSTSCYKERLNFENTLYSVDQHFLNLFSTFFSRFFTIFLQYINHVLPKFNQEGEIVSSKLTSQL